MSYDFKSLVNFRSAMVEMMPNTIDNPNNGKKKEKL